MMSAMVLGSVAVKADPADSFTTAAVKAAFIYNFAKFTTWPPGRLRSSSDRFLLCAQGSDLDRRALSPLEEKRIEESLVSVEVLAPGAPIDACHVFFASGFASEQQLREALEMARLHAVLMVSDMPGFAALGGHIGLIEDRSRIRFQINLQSVAQSGMKLSSKLLQLAEIVGSVRY